MSAKKQEKTGGLRSSKIEIDHSIKAHKTPLNIGQNNNSQTFNRTLLIYNLTFLVVCFYYRLFLKGRDNGKRI